MSVRCLWLRKFPRKGVEQVAEVLRQGNLDSPEFFSDLRFNAGMTKVYSLMCDNFIIYDSRVAAALGWLVMKYCRDRKLTALEPTRFRISASSSGKLLILPPPALSSFQDRNQS